MKPKVSETLYLRIFVKDITKTLMAFHIYYNIVDY